MVVDALPREKRLDPCEAHFGDAVIDVVQGAIDGLAAATTGCNKTECRVGRLEPQFRSDQRSMCLPALMAAIDEQRLANGDHESIHCLAFVRQDGSPLDAPVKTQIGVLGRLLADTAAK